jgi:uncharacterized protein YndB with AHSA1/START domain
MEAHITKMSNFFIKRSIVINASASMIWRVFTDPALTRQMGGEYVSDWKTSSLLSWKTLDGQVITSGAILTIVPGKLLQHTLRNSIRSTNSVISYELHETEGATILHAREDFSQPISESEYASALEGWDAALQAVKETAERTE